MLKIVSVVLAAGMLGGCLSPCQDQQCFDNRMGMLRNMQYQNNFNAQMQQQNSIATMNAITNATRPTSTRCFFNGNAMTCY